MCIASDRVACERVARRKDNNSIKIASDRVGCERAFTTSDEKSIRGTRYRDICNRVSTPIQIDAKTASRDGTVPDSVSIALHKYGRPTLTVATNRLATQIESFSSAGDEQGKTGTTTVTIRQVVTIHECGGAGQKGISAGNGIHGDRCSNKKSEQEAFGNGEFEFHAG
jgi:hypothetical protein